MKKPLNILLVSGLAVVCGLVLLQQRRGTSQRGLGELAPQITAITLYDIQGRSANSKALGSAIAVEFPLEVFQRACASATREASAADWKGSSLAVLTLRDGTQRQARFSYYGGFFAINGLSGHFVLPDRGSSEFQRLHDQLIQQQFIPRRHDRKRNRNA